jgi:hypothetical protein
VQFETALGTKARGRHPLQDRAALRTSRDGMGSRQIYRSRSEGVVSFRRRRARFFAGPLPRLLLPIAILISMLTVFSCHKTSPGVLAYCRASRVLRQAGTRLYLFLLREPVLGTHKLSSLQWKHDSHNLAGGAAAMQLLHYR